MARCPPEVLVRCLTFLRWAPCWAVCASVCRSWKRATAELFADAVQHLDTQWLASSSIREACATMCDDARRPHVALRCRAFIDPYPLRTLHAALNTLARHPKAPLESLWVDVSAAGMHPTTHADEMLAAVAAIVPHVRSALCVRLPSLLNGGPFVRFVAAVVDRLERWDVLRFGLVLPNTQDAEAAWCRLIARAVTDAVELAVECHDPFTTTATLDALHEAPSAERLVRLRLHLRSNGRITHDRWLRSLWRMLLRAGTHLRDVDLTFVDFTWCGSAADPPRCLPMPARRPLDRLRLDFGRSTVSGGTLDALLRLLGPAERIHLEVGADDVWSAYLPTAAALCRTELVVRRSGPWPDAAAGLRWAVGEPTACSIVLLAR